MQILPDRMTPGIGLLGIVRRPDRQTDRSATATRSAVGGVLARGRIHAIKSKAGSSTGTLTALKSPHSADTNGGTIETMLGSD